MTSPTNDDRAAWAHDAILDLCAATGCDLDDGLTDLLCDLMHWASLMGRNFDKALDQARMHFGAEA
ncbi:MAG: hypothetical protein F9K29_18315 [Hyphomicrobiaceae bacterium]|nr:MAG: hypothetical protein F9K29_18315 [Hyphomicrobiaceae bacterium]